MGLENYESSESYLEEQYKRMGDMRLDFRNANLNMLVKSHIKGPSILDIGCGNGFLLSILDCDNNNVAGIEPNEGLVTLARKYYPKVDIHKGFAEDINSLFTKNFDSVTMIDVLEHIEDDEAIIKKIHNQLNIGGRFVIVVPAFQFLFGIRDKNHGHYRRYSKKELVKKLEKQQFRIIKTRYWNMLGMLPYFISEKILRKELNTELRTEQKTAFKKFINRILNFWFKNIENKMNLGFGLSLLCVAEKVEISRDSQ